MNSVMGRTQQALIGTCSFVVLPRATNTMWNPVRPATGTKNRPATHITAILRGESQELYNKSKVKKVNTKTKNNNAGKIGKESPIICPSSLWLQWAKWRIRNSSMWCVQLLPVVQDINQAKAKYVYDVGSKWQQEEEEMAIIPPTNAVVHPRTVVVKILREHRVKEGQKERKTMMICILRHIQIRWIDNFYLPRSHMKTKNRTDLGWAVKSTLEFIKAHCQIKTRC